MATIIRQDAITLHSVEKGGDFERFMKEELSPYFNNQFKKPTRTTLATLESQSLLKDTDDQRKYLWVTTWDGSPEDVRGSFFENVKLGNLEETATKSRLKKLESFGKRTTKKIFTELP